LATAAARRAYAPYSGFPVGAAILTTDGRIFSGCNIENAALPEGWCAETTAISQMVMDGGGRIAEIAILALKADQCPPCGGCLQRIYEFADGSAKIHLCDAAGIVETFRLRELLPRQFVKGKRTIV
jgi:cytidine deaminase